MKTLIIICFLLGSAIALPQPAIHVRKESYKKPEIQSQTMRLQGGGLYGGEHYHSNVMQVCLEVSLVLPARKLILLQRIHGAVSCVGEGARVSDCLPFTGCPH